jgi:hypothetical protein
MRSLQQRAHLAFVYTVGFWQLACDLDWNRNSLMSQFQSRLKDNVKDLFLTMQSINTLSKFITQAIACNSRLFER